MFMNSLLRIPSPGYMVISNMSPVTFSDHIISYVAIKCNLFKRFNPHYVATSLLSGMSIPEFFQNEA